MSQTIKVVSNIDAGDAGTLVVAWELKSWHEEISDKHPDNWLNGMAEFREVAEIKFVEFQMFDKLGFVLPETYKSVKRVNEILEKQLLESVENKSIEEIKNDN